MGTSTRRREITRVGLALALVLVLLMPSLFIVAESHHDCTGDQCPVCKVIAGAVQIEQQGADVPHALAAAIVLLSVTVVACLRRTLLLATDTPVSLKVRMND